MSARLYFARLSICVPLCGHECFGRLEGVCRRTCYLPVCAFVYPCVRANVLYALRACVRALIFCPCKRVRLCVRVCARMYANVLDVLRMRARVFVHVYFARVCACFHRFALIEPRGTR